MGDRGINGDVQSTYSSAPSVGPRGNHDPDDSLAPAATARLPPRPAQLRMRLRGFQIFFIILSGIIGTNVFNGIGVALRLSGPLGLLTATVFAGVVAICVGETVSEMVQVFPVPNATFAYIRYWLDEDIAWAMGTLYWYAWATIFAQEMISAAKLLQYWQLEDVWPPLIFYFLVPCALIFLNLFPVDIYGGLETFGGGIKLAFIIVVTCILYHISANPGDEDHRSYISDGFQHNTTYAPNNFAAFCSALPTVMLGYLGVGSTTVAAYEAESRQALTWPSLWIHWVIASVYFFCTLGIILTVSWTNPKLPLPLESREEKVDGSPYTNSPTILAIYPVNEGLAGVVNGFLIFSVLSAGNTSLYYASRSLWGLTYGLPGLSPASRLFRGLSVLMRRTSSPGRALLFTWILFCWIPFLTLGNIRADDALQVLSLTSSLSCLIVWVALLVAFLRYKSCTARLAPALESDYSHYLRQSPDYLAKNYALSIQPFTAWLGLVGIFLIFIFGSAMWWGEPAATAAKILASYGAHMGVVIYFLVIKTYRGNWGKKWITPLDDEVEVKHILDDLIFLSDKSQARREAHADVVEDGSVSPPQNPIQNSDNANGSTADGGVDVLRINGTRLDTSTNEVVNIELIENNGSGISGGDMK